MDPNNQNFNPNQPYNPAQPDTIPPQPSSAEFQPISTATQSWNAQQNQSQWNPSGNANAQTWSVPQDNTTAGSMQTAQNQPAPTATTQVVELESPILSPTHFDEIQQKQQVQSVANPEPEKADKSTKQFMTLSIILGVVAVIGIALGIWGLIDAIGSRDQLEKANETIGIQSSIIKRVSDDTGVTITSADDVPAYSAVRGYIYISEWGIKIKIPSNLRSVSYILDQKFRPSICFNALESSITNILPAFADVYQNQGGMGCLVRVNTSEGDSDINTGASFGTRVFTYGSYNYFYRAPAKVFATDASEQGLEQTAVQIIKNMLTSGISHYE